MRDVKLDGETVPTVQVNGEEVHMLNGECDGTDLRLISNGVHGDNGENIPNGDNRSQSLGDLDETGQDVYDDSNRLDGSETKKAHYDKRIPSDNCDSTSNDSLDKLTTNIACDIPIDHEVETPLLKDNMENKTDIGENSFKYVIETEAAVSEVKHSKSDKQTTNTDNADKDKQHKTENKDKLRKSISRTQSCLDDPPDGGWGWVVTFSAFMVGLILDGISFSFGLFFKELYVYFNESKSLTSWIISVLNGTYLGIGKSEEQIRRVFDDNLGIIFVTAR